MARFITPSHVIYIVSDQEARIKSIGIEDLILPTCKYGVVLETDEFITIISVQTMHTYTIYKKDYVYSAFSDSTNTSYDIG